MRRLTRTIALAGAALLASACAPRDRNTVVINDTSRGAVGAPAIVSENANGMEVRWWFADDVEGRLGNVLAEFESAGTDMRTRGSGQIAANGVRIVRVPVDRAYEVQEAIGSFGSRKRTWLPATGVWSEIYRGRRVGESVPILIGGRRTRLEQGTVRMLARVWAAQTLEGSVLRADFATQVQEANATPASEYFERPEYLTEIDKGSVIRDLSFGATLDTRYVYIITCEEPGLVWDTATGEIAPPSEEIDDEDASQEFTLPDVLPGPVAKKPLTLGEVMLSARPEETGGRTIKSIIMVIPRLPSEARLLAQ